MPLLRTKVKRENKTKTRNAATTEKDAFTRRGTHKRRDKRKGILEYIGAIKEVVLAQPFKEKKTSFSETILYQQNQQYRKKKGERGVQHTTHADTHIHTLSAAKHKGSLK